MNTLLAKDVESEKKKRVLQDDFKISITEKTESEVPDMCNLNRKLKRKAKDGF